MINLDPDTLWRSHLRREMGFDFTVTIMKGRAFIKTVREPYLTEGCKVTEPLDSKSVQRIVKACMRLKKKYDMGEEAQHA